MTNFWLNIGTQNREIYFFRFEGSFLAGIKIWYHHHLNSRFSARVNFDLLWFLARVNFDLHLDLTPQNTIWTKNTIFIKTLCSLNSLWDKELKQTNTKTQKHKRFFLFIFFLFCSVFCTLSNFCVLCNINNVTIKN